MEKPHKCVLQTSRPNSSAIPSKDLKLWSPFAFFWKTDLPAKQCQTYLKFKHVNHRDVIHLNTLYLIDSTEAYLSEILVIYKINVVVLLCFLLTSKKMIKYTNKIFVFEKRIILAMSKKKDFSYGIPSLMVIRGNITFEKVNTGVY